MKTMTAMIFLSMITSVGFAQVEQQLKKRGDSNVPVVKTLVVESNRIDLGDVVELKDRDIEVKVKNVGAEPLLVGKVSTTALLVVKSKPATAIQPGQEGIIILTHRPSEEGQFMETFVIESNASNTMEVLKVFGTIPENKASIK